MARIGQPIHLSDEENQELLSMSQSHNLEKRYIDRAMIILHSAKGRSFDRIIELTGKSRPIVNKWRSRFRESRLEGLKDAPRSGKPKTITPEQKALVIEKACTKPEGGYTNWSQVRIAEKVGISQSRVCQILKKS